MNGVLRHINIAENVLLTIKSRRILRFQTWNLNNYNPYVDKMAS